MRRDEFKKIIREYFTFNRTERKGFTVLSFFIIIAAILHFLSGKIDFSKPADFTEVKRLLSEIEKLNQIEAANRSFALFTFDPNTISSQELDSLDLPRQIKSNIIRYRERGGKFRNAADFRRIYGMNDSIFAAIEPYLLISGEKPVFQRNENYKKLAERFFFNPNTVSESDLERLGFNNFQTRNLLTYRQRGGSFKTKSDLMKVYGVDEYLYNQLESWIELPESSAEKISESVKVKTIIELNSADSIQLIAIPGIGPVFSGRIIRYRQMLGGFYSINQLNEVFGMTPDRISQVEPYIQISTENIKLIRINFAERNELRAHPYIKNEQAQLIIRLR